MRYLLLSLLFIAAPFCAGLSHIEKKPQKFSGPQCSPNPKTEDISVSCKFIGSPDGIPTYSLLYGKNGVLLMSFNRSAQVIQGQRPYRIAINSYEGSNYTDCYVFWNANKPKRFLLSSAWLRSSRGSAEQARLLRESDHKYFTCSGWKADSVDVAARIEQADGSYLAGQGKLSAAGKISGIIYKVNKAQ